MKRRTFLGAGAGSLWAARGGAVPIIDAHTHFYDPRRPQGVPWPPKSDRLLYRPVLPAEFRKLTGPLGVTGTIVIEASPWLEDNEWVLSLAAKEPIIVGTVGSLKPGEPEFAAHLGRFHKNPLFRGIRLNRNSLASGLSQPRFVSDLKRLADAGLELDIVGGSRLIPLALRLSDAAPELRVVIDHLPFDTPAERAERAAYEAGLRELGTRPRIYAKVSNVLRRSGGRVRRELGYYRPALDELWEIFGPDRLIYGSNWPVSNRIAPYSAVLAVVREYFEGKGRENAEKYFSKNARVAYRWLDR